MNEDKKSLNASLVSQVGELLSTRALHQMAIELRLDGESLRDAVDRYEIDFAWHVLGSARLLDDTVEHLASRLQREPSAHQRAEVKALLNAAALGQESDKLMSFDNDLAQQLAELMITKWGTSQSCVASIQSV